MFDVGIYIKPAFQEPAIGCVTTHGAESRELVSIEADIEEDQHE